MRNLKHTIVALCAVSLVGTLATAQAISFSAAKATKLTQETEIVTSVPEVLPGDGEGETAEFSLFSPEIQALLGKDAYILTQDGGNINLRAAADIESTILDVLDVGTPVKILNYDNGWFNVETDGFTGYVKSEFVTHDYEQVKKVLLNSVMYQNGTVNVSSNVHGEPDGNSIILDMVGEGSKVIIIETTDNSWYRVYFGKNYDLGYISSSNITVGDMINRAEVNAKRAIQIFSVAKNGTITTTDNAVSVKLLPSTESETLTTLANGASCKIISGGKNWTKIIVTASNEIGYVKTVNIKQVSEKTTTASKSNSETSKSNGKIKSVSKAEIAPIGNASGAKLVAQAAKYIGTKYVYGGTSPSGFDCSGLVQYSLRQLGVSISRSSKSQYGYGAAVSRSNLQPGDLVFFSRGGGISHVAIYAGNDQVIHAPRAGKTVCYQSLSTLSRAMKYVGARRVI